MVVIVPVAAVVLVFGERLRCAVVSWCGPPICNPLSLQIRPSAVLHRGERLTVTSAGYACHHDQTLGSETVTIENRALTILAHGSAAVRPNGSFEVNLRLSDDAPIGPAFATASGPVRVECRQGSCEAFGVPVTVMP
ncbi:hypothetical protein BH10ACT8_BH10ACT8_29720 [soil metagenome]